MTKTNAARLLDGLGIQYEVRTYDVDPDDLPAPSVAHKVGLPAEQVFKTLVARGDRRGVLLLPRKLVDGFASRVIGAHPGCRASVTSGDAHCGR